MPPAASNHFSLPKPLYEEQQRFSTLANSEALIGGTFGNN